MKINLKEKFISGVCTSCEREYVCSKDKHIIVECATLVLWNKVCTGNE